MSSNSKFPIPVPFGGSGDKELITVTKKKNRGFLNTFGKGRFSPQDATDIVIILAIATDKNGDIDQGTVDMVESLFAGSYAENGLGRAEHLMMKTGIIAPAALPGQIARATLFRLRQSMITSKKLTPRPESP